MVAEKTAEALTPSGMVNTESVMCWPAGAWPEAISNRIVVPTMTMSATVMNSTVSSTREAAFAGREDNQATATNATAVGTSQLACVHTPLRWRKAVRNNEGSGHGHDRERQVGTAEPTRSADA
ncbi:hypothetical protein JK363_34825 [Streptomyces sp. 205]|uniref:Uncharacterized protein n=1 Tax=Streptomyces coffeae TaxID=621382 RepID=A0ABS1NNR8_9ACTN|nr:hypothetical protein [Streptomyces coffeae]MBL1101732.1 hypothetical protein [Streptomyces coffeae]